MALCLLNHFYFQNAEATFTFMLVDLSLAMVLHFSEKEFKKRRETKQMEATKKNDELHEKKKTTDRAMKTQSLDKKRNEHNNRANYKTHEKRSHRPPKHNIQQPSK
mmetsp:Transcript_19531/g.29255  ORF Transcript_19531/g.29255 Transcript_19531/m.29255 type:complete len:106 (+) Transcript_19531:127-444(+)|eukprot:CAMPEP_0203637312 /NCGR_PEP_ID=MMETSP0088-20131115/3661_1 /ASSEMBLY_ACC=CAM_ASM_001087 /TAXON_ID=426623 /ORGANISM="Chaetoceros affinis, Strain CCMP159" /LENGTH=105 /DNA_ID=CAMNT_0050491701 /DNA_START=38 /DNA_END=358 /DNA_ORIENTATION=-